MTRLTMPSAMPADRAEVLSDVDDELTPAEQDAIEKRAEEIINERLAHGDIAELFDGLDYKAWVPELQRACRANYQAKWLHDEEEKIYKAAALQAVSYIRHTLLIEARRVWSDDARIKAELEVLRGEVE